MRLLIRSLIFIFSLFLITACGYSVKENISPVSPPPGQGSLEKVIVLPFVDYTASPGQYWQRNKLILEALQDELFKFGFMVVPYEDVFQYLLAQGVVQEHRSLSNSLLYDELSGPWSEEMKQEIRKAIRQNQNFSSEGQTAISLDQNILQKLGKTFGARYVIRGRIIEFGDPEDDPLNPLQTGILPFVFKVSSRTIFGKSSSKTYEMLNEAATGALLGASVWWLSADDGLTGAGIGAGSALLAYQGGHVPQARVQLRLLVQDTLSGETIWSNRAEIQVEPESVFTPTETDKLFEKAVTRAVEVLTADLVKAIEGQELALSKQTHPLVEEAQKAAEEAKLAAQQAQKAAQKAGAAALKTERIFEKTLVK